MKETCLADEKNFISRAAECADEKISIIGIFIDDQTSAVKVNALLHEYGDCIIGRMGIPYREKSMNIISIIVCADAGRISALSGKLGRINGISSKAMQAQVKKQSFHRRNYMMKQKLVKWISVAAAIALNAGLLTACGAANESVTESLDQTVRVMALKGPTSMGMVQLMNEAETNAVNGNSYEFTIAASADEVTPMLVQGKADIAAVPANLASVLYHNTKGEIQVLAINTLGVLYIVENGNTVQSAADLKGKTIYASGKGSTPEYALNYILSANNIDPEKDVTIEWKSEHSECVAALATDAEGIAMLPQPFVTTAQIKNDNIRIALDLTDEWEQTSGTLITGVVVVRADFAAEHPDAVNAFLDSYKASVGFVNKDNEGAASLIEKYDIVPAAVAIKALPYCNITFIEGADMKTRLSGYLDVLMQQNPKAIGGTLPADDFYYSR